MLLLAKSRTGVSLGKQVVSGATITVAFVTRLHAALGLSPCVRTVKTWMTISAMANVTLGFQQLRTRIVGRVPMAPRGVSSTSLAVTEIQIVTLPLIQAIPAMNRIVH